jgi:hypothetical protein
MHKIIHHLTTKIIPAMHHAKKSISPTTHLGKWSFGFGVAFLWFFMFFELMLSLGKQGGETFFSNLYLAIPLMIAGICGVMAFFTGTVAIFRKERSVLVLLSALVGLVVLIFWIGEIFPGH